jgi:hypothetical protein
MPTIKNTFLDIKQLLSTFFVKEIKMSLCNNMPDVEAILVDFRVKTFELSDIATIFLFSETEIEDMLQFSEIQETKYESLPSYRESKAWDYLPEDKEGVNQINRVTLTQTVQKKKYYDFWFVWQNHLSSNSEDIPFGYTHNIVYLLDRMILVTKKSNQYFEYKNGKWEEKFLR